MKRIILVFLACCILMVGCSAQDNEPNSLQQQENAVSSELTIQSQSNETQEQMQQSTQQVQSQKEQASNTVLLKTAVIENGSHGVTAQISLFSDNTLVLENVNYDGKAPDVYIAIGNKTEGEKFEKTKLVTEKIEEELREETIIIQLEESDDFNAVSIYCDFYADDFGSAILQDE